MSNSLQPYGLQHARLPCPLPSPGVRSNSCPLSQWCYPTILSSISPFFSCLQSFLASGFFPVNWLFTSGGQSIAASASDLEMKIQGWFPSGLTGLISLLSKGLSSVFSSTPIWKHQFFGPQPFLVVQLSHPYMATGNTIALTICTFVGKMVSLLFNMPTRFVIAFLPRSNHLLILWLQSPSAVILEPKEIKSIISSTEDNHSLL